MLNRPDRVLLIVAPSLVECHRTATEFGLDPRRLCNFRAITKAALLRGTTRGTPFIAIDRDQWCRTPEGRALWLMVNHLETTCQIRPMRADEAAAYQEGVFA